MMDSSFSGLMFHHFHNDNHPEGQGSISSIQFEQLLDFMAEKYEILSADEWLYRFYNNSLSKKQVCITFDDNLRCQYDVALPVLKAKNLNAFWYVHTCTLEGDFDRLELYRYFRTNCFETVEEFYHAFKAELYSLGLYDMIEDQLAEVDLNQYLCEFPFYSLSDRWFRYVRDRILGSESYYKVMDSLTARKWEDPKHLHSKLWMDKSCLKKLCNEGHILGLHSHNHPTNLAKLTYSEQKKEYKTNYNYLVDITGTEISTAAHPCGSFNTESLSILKSLGIRVGFDSRTSKNADNPLVLPRLDHAIAIEKMMNTESKQKQP